ncbi:MAG TPA: spore coat U domain-containing protein [Steroidobacteraceae bacterium]|nr:spore coat U domain-containing protein [Steroidobacteraceae bacterium]
MLKKTTAPIATAVLFALAGSAQAYTNSTTAQFTVGATYQSNCLATATNINFGNFNGTADLTSNGTISVNCTNGTPFSVGLSTGSGTFATRTMKSGSNVLNYNLYLDNQFTTIWDNASNLNSGTGAGMGSGSVQTYTVFGKLPYAGSNQSAPPGSYSDTITATVSY